MEIVEPETVDEWRRWLVEHHATADEVWLVIQHKASSRSSPTYAEAVEQALCVGWVDGVKRGHDDHSSIQRFTPRRAGSAWSRSNRDRVGRLTADGLMLPAGQARVDEAVAAGTWLASEVVPDDLAQAFDAETGSRATFDGFALSTREQILLWIAAAKRPATRIQRIERTVAAVAQGSSPV